MAKKNQSSVRTTGKAAKSARKPAKEKVSAVVAHVLTEDEKREAVMRPVNQWRSYMRRLLNADGTYNKKYSYQVTLAAQSMRLLQECYFQIAQSADVPFTVTEISREGNPRATENPLLTMYIKLDAMCRKNLSALGMNMSNIVEGIEGKAGTSDPLRELMEKMK